MKRFLRGVVAVVVSSVLLGSGSMGASAFALTPKAGDEKRPIDGVVPEPTKVIREARAEIVLLHATNDNNGIDPSIGKLPQLAQPPFSAYNTYRLIERSNLALPLGELKNTKLPDGGKLSLTLKEASSPKKEGQLARFRVGITIEKDKAKPFLPDLQVSANDGELFFVAGQQYRNGILVVGIRLVPSS